MRRLGAWAGSGFERLASVTAIPVVEFDRTAKDPARSLTPGVARLGERRLPARDGVRDAGGSSDHQAPGIDLSQGVNVAIEAVGIELKPHPVDALGGQEGRRPVSASKTAPNRSAPPGRSPRLVST